MEEGPRKDVAHSERVTMRWPTAPGRSLLQQLQLPAAWAVD